MSIEYAILGLVEWRPMSGYDIKKIFAEPTSLYWSDNNNLIYRTLIAMHKEGLLTCEIHYQDERPPRKVYSISPKGRDVLQAWLHSEPAVPYIRHSFLIQFAWAGSLEKDEIDHLLETYEEEISMHLLIYRKLVERGQTSPARSPQEVYLWKQVHANRISFYENELNWVRETRRGLAEVWPVSSGYIATTQ